MRYICVEFIDKEHDDAIDQLENYLNDNEVNRNHIVSITSSCTNDFRVIIDLVYFKD